MKKPVYVPSTDKYPATYFHPNGKTMLVKSEAEIPPAPWRSKPFPPADEPASAPSSSPMGLSQARLMVENDELRKANSQLQEQLEAERTNAASMQESSQQQIDMLQGEIERLNQELGKLQTQKGTHPKTAKAE